MLCFRPPCILPTTPYPCLALHLPYLHDDFLIIVPEPGLGNLPFPHIILFLLLLKLFECIHHLILLIYCLENLIRPENILLLFSHVQFPQQVLRIITQVFRESSLPLFLPHSGKSLFHHLLELLAGLWIAQAVRLEDISPELNQHPLG